MEKDLIIDVEPEQVSIALLQDKRLIEFSQESTKGKSFSVGDVYVGKVKKIIPSLNAAFVDIGDEKEAFVHYFDLGLNFRSFDYFTKQINNGKDHRMFFEGIKVGNILEKEGKIADCLQVGQPIMVQIVKEPISTKGSRLTAEISIPGRNMVLMPFSDKVSISQKISSKTERNRLERLMYSILPKNYGVIIRTAAEGKRAAVLDAELKTLIEKWCGCWQNLAASKNVQLLFTENNRTTTIIRDLLNDTFSNVYVNDDNQADQIYDYIATISPGQEKIVHHYKGSMPIFDHFDINRQIKSSFGKVVSIKKGAYLVIEHTEALHVVDVNSGIRNKQSDHEENALMVNMAAAEEIARQMRLRDMGGIVIIDFIDMDEADHRAELFKYMQQLMSSDRAKHTVLPLTKFGLMQITRQRVRPATELDTTEVCPSCGGTGKISSSIILDQQIEEQLSEIVAAIKPVRLTLVANPIMAAYLTKGFPSIRLKWSRKYKCAIRVVKDFALPIMQDRWIDAKGQPIDPSSL